MQDRDLAAVKEYLPTINPLVDHRYLTAGEVRNLHSSERRRHLRILFHYAAI
jgi:hypothetical protein